MIRRLSTIECLFQEPWPTGLTSYGQLGKYSEAIADFEMALKLDPGNTNYIENIAKTKRARGW